MSSLLLWSIAFVVSLATLIKASDVFTEGAEKLGLLLGVPPFIIGVTIVALGTSLPELVSSLIAATTGSPEIVVGNVVGSNITNIFLVLGMAGILGREVVIRYDYLHLDLAFLLAVTVLLAITCWDGTFSRWDAALCCVGMVLHLLYNLNLDHGVDETVEAVSHQLEAQLAEAQAEADEAREAGGDPGPARERREPATTRRLEANLVLALVLSALFIFLGARYTVESVVAIAGILKIGTEIVAVSVVALGTSLPELSVTVSAARRGKAELAVGNVLGSNIFNTLYVMGIPALVAPLPIPPSLLDFSLPVMLIATGVFVAFCLDRRISLWEGAALTAGYGAFLIGLILA